MEASKAISGRLKLLYGEERLVGEKCAEQCQHEHRPVAFWMASNLTKRPGALNSLKNCGRIPERYCIQSTPGRASFLVTKKNTAAGRVTASRYLEYLDKITSYYEKKIKNNKIW